MSYVIQSDAQLKARVRTATQYANNEDELADSDLDNIVDDAKLKVYLETGTDQWYTDSGIGLVLYAYTCMRAKAAVENISIEKYTLGNETVTMRNADPEDSQQIQQWADDIRTGLSASSLNTTSKPTIVNTSEYIGENYIGDYDHEYW